MKGAPCEHPFRGSMKPEEGVPVLAEIEYVDSIGTNTWAEIVYFFQGDWCSWSATFEDGEKVVKWKYVSDCLAEGGFNLDK